MAYPVGNLTELAPGPASASYTVATSALGAVADDYVVVFVLNSATSGTITEANGYTLTHLAVGSGQRMAIAYKKVAAGPTIADAVFSATSGLWQAFVGVVRDADTGTFNDGTIITADGLNATSAETGALTPTYDNSLVFYFAGVRNTSSATPLRFLPSDVVAQGKQVYDDGSVQVGICVGTVQQGAAAVTTKRFYASQISRCGSIVLAVRNKAGGKLYSHAVPALTKIAWMGPHGTAHDSTITWAQTALNATDAPTSWDGSAKINGITVQKDASQTKADADLGLGGWGRYTTLQGVLNTASGWVGYTGTLSASIDLTGKFFTLEFFMSASISAALGTGGAIVAFRDSAGDWAAFKLSDRLGWQYNQLYTAVIDVENATPLDSSAGHGGGTMTWNDVASITLLHHRAGSVATATRVGYRNMQMLGSTTLYGGNASQPLDITFLSRVLNGWGYEGLCDRLGDTINIKSSIQIGNGSFETHYDGTATAISTNPPYDAMLQRAVNVGANKIGITVLASASDSIGIDACSIVAGQEQNFTIDPSSSASAPHTFSGAVLGNLNFTGDVDIDIDGPTFSGCAPVATKGANFSGFSVTGTTATSTEAAVTVDGSGSTLSIGTIDVTGTSAGYHIELGTAVTAITLANVTFTGTPGTDKVHVLKTSGTVTITISGTTSLVAGDVTTAGATVVIAAPQPTLDATVLASSRVVLYNNTTAAELDNTAPGGTSWSKVITSGASANDSLTLHVFKEGYEEFSTTFLYTGDDATILVTQAADANLTSLRSELSITDYTTITEFALDVTGTVEVDADDADGSTLKARLAIWYNGVLTTENGARYLRGAITILSTAAFRINVDVLDLQVTNISVTNGLQFTDTERRLYRSDGTPVYSSTSVAGSIQNDYSGVPDTVETGVSGLTGSESAQLMGLPSATAIANEVVNVVTFP